LKKDDKISDMSALMLEISQLKEEISFLNKNKEMRNDELIIANKELEFQNREKEKRIVEISELKEAQLFVEKQLFEKTLLAIGDGVISTDKNKNVLFMNKVAEELTGWSKEEAIGKTIYSVFNIMSEYTRRNDEDIIEKVFRTKSIHNLANHTILVMKDGKENLIEDSAAPIFNIQNDLIGVVIVFRDYTEKWERLKNIQYLNYHDDLTTLYNRRFFEEELTRLDVARNLPLSIIMADINGLKLVNDSFGHRVGDELLQKTANSLKEVCRKDEISARLGGDEFAIILPKCNEKKAQLVIERIKDNLSNKKVNKLDISVAFGLSCKKDSSQDIQEVLKTSENLMYQNKLFQSASIRSKTIDIIVDTLFAKNDRESDHSKRVSELAVKLAKFLKLNSSSVNSIKTIGLLHDIGKIGITDTILNKVGLLACDEYDELKKHSEIGARILSNIIEFKDISTAVLQHHERWDGKGYPQGLKGEEICIEARIVSLADAFDAITSDRTYRPTRTKEEAIIEITKCSRTQFDPELCKAFIKMINTDTTIK
jgi:diguanylate cyclase